MEKPLVGESSEQEMAEEVAKQAASVKAALSTGEQMSQAEMAARDHAVSSATQTSFYVQDSDGRFYQEVPVPGGGGGYNYVPAQPGLAYQPCGNGKFIAVRDMSALESQRLQNSHRAYFNQNEDPKVTRAHMKRQEALARQFELMAVERVAAPSGPSVERVKDEQALALLESYRLAVAAGRAAECDFQPLATYQHKLTTRSGRILRPTYAGEIGMRGSTVVVLEAGYGTGALVQVPGGENNTQEG